MARRTARRSTTRRRSTRTTTSYRRRAAPARRRAYSARRGSPRGQTVRLVIEQAPVSVASANAGEVMAARQIPPQKARF